MTSKLIENHARMDKLPHIWCPGCGHGIVMRSVMKAIDDLDLDYDKVCIVSGIGCSSRAPGYMNFNTLHTTHGRALAFATGLKLANPELEIIVLTGDGDASAIGGNHLIHACRRNIGLTTIVFNNNIYGMTGGQYSPTTPTTEKGTTAPYGNIDRNFDLCNLAIGAGATYSGRSTVYHVDLLTSLIKKGIQNKGFSLVEAVSLCPTYYGRKNKKGSAVDMMNFLKDAAIRIEKTEDMTSAELENKITIGEMFNKPQAEYTQEYLNLINRFQKER